MLDLNKLRSLYEARPFNPFEVVFQDGRAILIDEPFYIGWSEQSKTISFASGAEAVEGAPFDAVVDLRPSKATQPSG